MTISTTTNVSDFEPTVPDLGAERVQQWLDIALTDASSARLAKLGTHGERELDQLAVLAGELMAEICNHGPLEGLRRFFLKASSYQDALDRLSAMHTVEHLEGVRPRKGQRDGLRPAPFPGWVNPDDPHRQKRLLRPLEFSLVRISALDRSPQHTAIIGFGEAGAVTGELLFIDAALIDTNTNEVALPGVVDGLVDRIGAIPSWSAPCTRRLAEARSGAKVLVYGGVSKDPAKVQSAIAMAATNVFRDAGIAGDPAVSFYSLRYSIGRLILDSAGTDKAVEFLGERNYSLVRQKLGLAPAQPTRRRR